MNVRDTTLVDVKIIEPKVFGDDRGFFFESFNQDRFCEHTGTDVTFVQDNHSRSARGVLRGLHYQIEQAQGKLVRVARGTIFDVAVDIRKSSPEFGKWFGVELSETNQHQLWVPAGYAHGFLVTSESADVMYKTTDYYAPQHERSIAWDDAEIGIAWPETTPPLLSEKDQNGNALSEAELYC